MTYSVSCRLASTALAALLSGCSSSGDGTTGKGSIRGLHAIPELGTVSFLIEETALSSLNYKESSGTSEFDNLNYDFSFDIRLPGDYEATRLATETVSVNPETEYTFVLAGSFSDPEIILWQQFGRNWAQELEDADEAGTEVFVLETSFGHLDVDLGRIDVFIEAPGTSPRSTTPVGTIEYGEMLPAVELLAGAYQIIVTPSGDPETILFASESIELLAATSNLFTVMDSAGLITADFGVRWIGTGLGIELIDIFVQPEISVLHAAYGTGAVDVVIGGDFGNPIVAGLEYADVSANAPVEEGSLSLIVTPAADPGLFLAQKEISVGAGTYTRLFLAGLPGEMQTVALRHDRYRLATHARVQTFHGAARFQSMDIYLVLDNVDITLVGATYPSTLFGSGSVYTSFVPGAYNLVLTEPGTKNIVGGPFHFDLEAGRNYGIAVVDAPDITAADVIFFDQKPD